MNIIEITPAIRYVGVNDRSTPRFEQMWPLTYGVSYNSYLVCGEKTALIDSVEIGEYDALMDNLCEAGIDTVDYLVVNHMEPDHSGSIPVLLDRFPQMKIVCNKISAEQIKGYYHLKDISRLHVVADGDLLDLGGRTLQFVTTPMVHWPETMMTFCREDSVLFTGDAFGCFGALNGRYLDTQMSDAELETYFSEMYRYYACIVAKYGRFVQGAMGKTAALGYAWICPTHGPVWHRCIERVADIYRRLSLYEPEEGVTLIYGSMYGHTAELADRLCTALAAAGFRNIHVHNAANAELCDMITDCVRYGTIVIGSPTYSMDIFPPVAALLRALKVREMKNRVTAAFGSFTWAMGALPKITQELTDMGLAPSASMTMKHAYSCEIEEIINKFVNDLRQADIKEKR